MPVLGAYQFRGHVIEGNRPEVFSDWRFFFIGIAGWWALVCTRLNRLAQEKSFDVRQIFVFASQKCFLSQRTRGLPPRTKSQMRTET